MGAAGTWSALNGQVVWRLASWASTSEVDLMPSMPATHGNAMVLGTTMTANRKMLNILGMCVVVMWWMFVVMRSEGLAAGNGLFAIKERKEGS